VVSLLGAGQQDIEKKIKPNIIMVSSGTMGQTEPYATLPDFGGHLSALFSFNYIIGSPDREPANV